MSAINHRWQRDVQIYRYPLLSAPFLFWGVLAVIGITLSLGRLFTGLWFTGMSDDYAWGVWKTFNVMTLTALGSGGLAVGVFSYVFGAKKLHVVMRTALASSLLFYATGMVALGIDVGRPWNLYHLLLPWNWNLHSSLFEVAACMTAYVVLFLSFENIPMLLEKAHMVGDAEKRAKLNVWMHRVKRMLPWMIAAAYVLPMMHQSSLGSLMVIAGHKVHPLWQTQMLPALYLVQAFVCGFAAVIFILMSASLAWHRPLDVPVLSELAKYMSWTAFVFIALRAADVLIRGVVGLAFQPTWYALLFHAENLLVLVPALLLLNPRLRATPRVVFVASMLTALGGILYRFTPTTLAYRAGHPSVYFPKIAEVLMSLGYIGLAVVLFIWAAKKFAILPGSINDWNDYAKHVASEEARGQQNIKGLRIEHGAATDH
jgi:Ni/Fe-hydrogenase subunit HybB-like protein